MDNNPRMASYEAEAQMMLLARTHEELKLNAETHATSSATGRTTVSTRDHRESNPCEVKHQVSSLERNWLRWSLAVFLLCSFLGCYGKQAPPKNESGAANPSAVDTKTIVDRYRGLDTSSNSTARMKVVIEETAGTREFRLTMHRKRNTDGSQLLLIEFTSPSEERDRSSLISITPQGEIEATRYAQSSDSFVSARGVTNEDSLFGMSLQELAEGQPEKYNFTLVGEETFKSAPVYRLEGKLREGEESKFPRVVFLISKETFAAQLGEFYDKNSLVRRITVNRIEKIDGIPTRMHWTIDNISRQKKIDFEALSVAYNQKLSDSIFSRGNLKKISSK